MNKKYVLISLILALSIFTSYALVGCSFGINKVAFIPNYTNTQDDGSFNEACWDGVEYWCQNNNAQSVSYPLDEMTDENRAAKVEKAVADGADAVVLAGSMFGVTIAEAQVKYPEVYFIGIDINPDSDMVVDGQGVLPKDNTVCITFAEEEAGFLAGYAAVKAGYRQLGFFGGLAIRPIISFGQGFVQGCDTAAIDLNLSSNVNIKYCYANPANAFIATAENKNKMKYWYANGTEVIFSCGGGMYESVMDAALEVSGEQMMIGVDVDQYNLGQNKSYNPVLTSAVKGLTEAVKLVLGYLADGQWASECARKVKHLSLKDGNYVGLPTNANAFSALSEKGFSIAVYNAIVNKIKTNQITVANNVEADLSTVTYSKATVEYLLWGDMQSA